MLPKHSYTLLPVLIVAWLTPFADAKPKGGGLTKCYEDWRNNRINSCELVECECQDKGGVFWTDALDGTCASAEDYGCIFGDHEEICSDRVPDNQWCVIIPTELGNSDRDPDSPAGPTIGDAHQVVMPIEGGSGIPGAVGGGPGSGELTETDSDDPTDAFDPGEEFQANEWNAWFAPGAYGRGAEFQMDAFLADAPLDYLEALLELQTLDFIRPDAPVAYYLTNGGNHRNLNTASTSPSPCGSGLGAPVVMLSLCWMFAGMNRNSRRATHHANRRSN